MVIKIDIRSLNEKFKSVIIHDINTEYQHNLKNHKNVGDDDKDINLGIDNDRHTITLDKGKDNIQKIERMIKDILIKRRIDDYVVIQDAKEKEKIVILKREQVFIIAIIVEWHSRMKSN